MIINIASFGGRTHMLDTARELEKFGHTVRFYSYVPTKRAIQFGLKEECSYSLFYWSLPFLILFKVFGYKNWNQQLYWRAFDYFTAFYMKPCDVFIGQSPMHVFALKYAKRKFNAIAIIERGTSHILNFIELLKKNPKLNGKLMYSYRDIKRDLAGYENADYISIASHFQRESFTLNGIMPSKLFVNPYGTNLKEFSPTPFPKNESYDVIFVGGWSYRKGCDLLIEAVREMKIKLLHVGAIVDVDFPKEDLFTHINSVNQSKLRDFYSNAKVFVLPSREDGFGMVLCQAMACGLPIVCSKNTGGKDLISVLDDKRFIFEMEEYSLDSLISSISAALDIHFLGNETRNYSGVSLEYFSWEAYGMRYNTFLKGLLEGE